MAARLRPDLNALDGLRLHIGGRQQKEGWRILNVQPGPGVDYLGDCSDLSRFADESVDEIYASHVLEHLSYVGKLPAALAEFHRVLKQGGVARISVPDFEVLCRLFFDSRCTKANRFEIMRMVFGGQFDPYDFHHVGLTYEFLEDYLGVAGFSRVERVTEFGLFEDYSSLQIGGSLISLNVVAYKGRSARQPEPMANCPVCDSVLSAPLGMRLDGGGRVYDLEQCGSCGCAFTAPRPDDATLQRLYGESYDYRWFRDHYDAKLADARSRFEEYEPWLGASVLDFGGGLGYFAAAAREAGLRSETLDPHSGASPTLPGDGWDSVVALHVLEHSNDPGAMLEAIRARLKPGGSLILAVPNYAGAGYRERGMHWVWAQPPLVHVFHFTARGLAALLLRHGFDLEQVDYRERWDANYVSDVLQVERFARLEADWARRPWSRFALYRKYIADRNAELRFEALERSLREHAMEPSLRAELQVRARLRAGA